jgi:hypothetical protein
MFPGRMRADTQRPQLSGGEVCAQRSGRARIRRNLGLTPYRLPGCWPHCPFGPFRCTISIPRSVNDEPPSDVYPVQAACRCLRSVMTLRPVRSLPSGGIMPDHASDRGAVRLDPGASRSQAYQPDEHAQTQYVRTWPSACRRPRQRRSSTPGCSNCTRSHPPPASVFPRARHGRSLPGAANLHFGHLRGIGHREPGTWKDPDPRRRSSRGSGAQNRPACPATAARRRLRAVPSQRLPSAMVSGAHAAL